MKDILFVQTGTGTDVHGQDITKAAVRAVEDAIYSNSMPGIEKALPNGSLGNMEVNVRLAVPLDREQVDTQVIKQMIPDGNVQVEVTEGGMATSSGIILKKENDDNDLMYIVNAAIEVGA
ncbi:Lin0512 family protein [Aquibacillus koreensis]|uniref:Lin0512 family protein n=1 Tax=Aquibacillus koreensis TaxID=279446 RepID=A0A9X3WPC5_9BACI|nr:Lin0512 family protein [Aquibacillus koreensis]MCT2537857.1 Lin0512 family protein [Aquibacillus koreensis]MDC3421111.1 Lin0512 family protein [Aquibacillus koreensis]